MKIEGEWLIFSSSRKEFAEDGLVALDLDGNIRIIGLNDHLGTPELSEQEKWELARYMIEHWMDVRDKLWARHEDAMKREEPVETIGNTSVGKILEESKLSIWDGIKEGPPFNCRCQVVPAVEELTDGPKCGDTTCFEYEDMMKDNCNLSRKDRDQCGT